MGTDHPDTLDTRNNLASAYQEAGNLTRETALYEKNQADRKRVQGTNHPTLTARNNPAIAYQHRKPHRGDRPAKTNPHRHWERDLGQAS